MAVWSYEENTLTVKGGGTASHFTRRKKFGWMCGFSNINRGSTWDLKRLLTRELLHTVGPLATLAFLSDLDPLIAVFPQWEEVADSVFQLQCSEMEVYVVKKSTAHDSWYLALTDIFGRDGQFRGPRQSGFASPEEAFYSVDISVYGLWIADERRKRWSS